MVYINYTTTRPFYRLSRLSGNHYSKWKYGESSVGILKPFINTKTSHTKSNVDTLFKFSMWLFSFSSAFPIKSDYLQFDFSACSSSMKWREPREKATKQFGLLNDSNQIVLLLVTPSPFLVSHVIRSRYARTIVWLTSIFHLITFWSGLYALLFHSGILMIRCHVGKMKIAEQLRQQQTTRVKIINSVAVRSRRRAR